MKPKHGSNASWNRMVVHCQMMATRNKIRYISNIDF
jgi:hypothetical protein